MTEGPSFENYLLATVVVVLATVVADRKAAPLQEDCFVGPEAVDLNQRVGLCVQ
jgi:hypothetical protein